MSATTHEQVASRGRDLTAVHRAILDDPADDLPRLAYADLLEEQGDEKRAEFVRLQCRRVERQCEFCDGTAPSCFGAICNDLAQREKEIAVRCGSDWGKEVATALNLPFPEDSLFTACEGDKRDVISWKWRRGFVESVKLPLTYWLKRGPALVRLQPLTRVEISDRRPFPAANSWGWFSSNAFTEADVAAHTLPAALYACLQQVVPKLFGSVYTAYPAQQVAVDTLSAACLAWARKEPLR